MFREMISIVPVKLFFHESVNVVLKEMMTSTVSVITIFFGVSLDKSGAPDYTIYILAAFVAWQVLVQLLLELFQYLGRNAGELSSLSQLWLCGQVWLMLLWGQYLLIMASAAKSKRAIVRMIKHEWTQLIVRTLYFELQGTSGWNVCFSNLSWMSKIIPSVMCFRL